MRTATIFLAIALLFTSITFAQDPSPTWQRSRTPVQPEIRVLHSRCAINLPTTETLDQGLFHFEVGHRFFPTIENGEDHLFGLDGPANIRLGFGYAPTDRLLIILGRSNERDNLDLQGKYKLYTDKVRNCPWSVAVQAGAAWNTAHRLDRSVDANQNFQYYAQAVGNILFEDLVGVGVVPSFLYNSNIDLADREELFAAGLYLQVYVTKTASIIGEWTPDISGTALSKDPIAFGVELETGGHFFKVFATNSLSINPSLYLAGTHFETKPDEWRLGFLITRILQF